MRRDETYNLGTSMFVVDEQVRPYGTAIVQECSVSHGERPRGIGWELVRATEYCLIYRRKMKVCK